MTPSPSLEDGTDGTLVNPVLLTNFRGAHARRVFRADGRDVCGREFGPHAIPWVRHERGRGGSPLLSHVAHVVARRAQEQMRGVAASRFVARVTDELLRGDLAVRQQPRVAMGRVLGSSNIDLPITATPAARPRPQPARRLTTRAIDRRPKRLGRVFGFPIRVPATQMRRVTASAVFAEVVELVRRPPTTNQPVRDQMTIFRSLSEVDLPVPVAVQGPYPRPTTIRTGGSIDSSPEAICIRTVAHGDRVYFTSIA